MDQHHGRKAATDLASCIAANKPVLLMGAPGTAKTATIESIAAAGGYYLEVVIASAQDPTTILGIPMPTADRKYTEATMPGWARRINEAAAQGRPTILFLDELTSVPPSIAAPLLGVVQSRRADGWTIPAETRIVAAANPPDLAVGGWALEPAMANRWTHIDWPAPIDEWVGWAREQGSAALALIADFIHSVPDMLLVVPTDIRKRSGPWPSPRSWTNAAGLIDGTGDYGIARLTVGDQAADAFVGWVATRDVPSVESLLNGTAELPDRPDAFVQAIRNLAKDGPTIDLPRTVALLRRAATIDAGLVAAETARIARAGHIAGIGPLVEDLQAAGIDLLSIAAAQSMADDASVTR